MQAYQDLQDETERTALQFFADKAELKKRFDARKIERLTGGKGSSAILLWKVNKFRQSSGRLRTAEAAKQRRRAVAGWDTISRSITGWTGLGLSVQKVTSRWKDAVVAFASQEFLCWETVGEAPIKVQRLGLTSIRLTVTWKTVNETMPAHTYIPQEGVIQFEEDEEEVMLWFQVMNDDWWSSLFYNRYKARVSANKCPAQSLSRRLLKGLYTLENQRWSLEGRVRIELSIPDGTANALLGEIPSTTVRMHVQTNQAGLVLVQLQVFILNDDTFPEGFLLNATGG